MKFSITLGAILAAAFGCDAGAIDSRQEPMQANINAYDDDACGTVPLKSLILLSDSYNKCGSYPWDFQSVMPQLLNNSCERKFPIHPSIRKHISQVYFAC